MDRFIIGVYAKKNGGPEGRPAASMLHAGGDFFQHAHAGLFALTARFGADPAVLMASGVPLALLGADPARLQLRPDERRHRFGLPRQYAGRDLADIGTVEIEGPIPSAH